MTTEIGTKPVNFDYCETHWLPVEKRAVMASASGWAEEMSFYQRLQLTRSATVDEINLRCLNDSTTVHCTL